MNLGKFMWIYPSLCILDISIHIWVLTKGTENRRTRQQIRGIQRDITRIIQRDVTWINGRLDGLNERLNALERQVQLLIRASGNSYLGAIEDELLDLAGY
jgi:hypothetical protein